MKKIFALIIASVSTHAATISDITRTAETSTCSAYRWKDRGRAPEGYVKGMALAYARNLCRWKSPASTVAGIIGKTPGDSSHDALTYYGIKASTSTERLRKTWAFGIGLGMRESSGKYCIGRDTTASSVSSTEAEAGPFQPSYNTAGASTKLGVLWSWYVDNGAQCDLGTWSQGVDKNYPNCRTASYGSGAGLQWQKFTRSCPSFAAEWAMPLTRVLRKHFGPINRKEVEFYAPCDTMLKTIESIVDGDPSLCKALGVK